MDVEALRLARVAIEMGATTSGCCEWDYDEALRVLRDPELFGYTPAFIREMLIKFVMDGCTIEQRKETRPEYGHREYWYRAIIPDPSFKNGLFVELELTDPDLDVPTVIIFNSHPQK